VDYDGPTPHIYDIANCSLLELRGKSNMKEICNRHLHGILMDLKDHVTTHEPDSLLNELYVAYDREMDDRPRSKYK
jgi:hypothetical protein